MIVWCIWMVSVDCGCIGCCESWGDLVIWWCGTCRGVIIGGVVCCKSWVNITLLILLHVNLLINKHLKIFATEFSIQQRSKKFLLLDESLTDIGFPKDLQQNNNIFTIYTYIDIQDFLFCCIYLYVYIYIYLEIYVVLLQIS